MTVVNLWVGATTPHSAWVVGKVAGVSSVRLAVAEHPTMIGAALTGAVAPTSDGMVRLQATGLEPNTRYWYQLETDSALDGDVGTFLTHPPLGEPGSAFTFWAATCAGQSSDYPGVGDVLAPTRLSDHPVHELIRDRALTDAWLFGWYGGDRSYYDPGRDPGHEDIPSGEAGYAVEVYRRMHDDVLRQPRAQMLHRDMSIVYSVDDHDGGPDNHNGSFPGIPNCQQVYREKVPHYPLPDPGASYFSFQVARTLFVAADVRSARDPNGAPAGPDKTMLGPAQRAWMEDILSQSTAELLVWLMPDRWRWGSGSVFDSWYNYVDERDQLVEMFGDLGWLGRMAIVCGDAHNLGIDSGTSQDRPIPNYQFAPLDAGTSPAVPAQFDTVAVGGVRGVYGTIEVDDRGGEIQVTASGWVMSALQGSHTFVVSGTAPPPPPPPPAPTPVASARIRTRLTWLGCDLVTGQVIAELPDVTGSPSRIIGEPTSAGLTAPIPIGGYGAVPLTTVLQATQPGRTMVVCVINDVPAWAGLSLRRTGGTEGTLQLATATPESYLDRRYVGDHSWEDADEATIVTGLLGDAQVEGIGLVLDCPPTGRIRTRSYADQDDATVLSRLQELAGVIDGPEWTIDLDWTDETHTAVAKIFRLRPRIGRAATAPRAVFQIATSTFSAAGSSDASYEFDEDLTAERHANHVVATSSSGEGEDRPQSPPARDEVQLAGGVPRYEHRWSPSSAITDVATLIEHAEAALGRRRNGALTWDITARWDAYPRYGVDWELGDDIGWELAGHRHPAGVAGIGRAIGWELDIAGGRMRPVLLDPASDPGTVDEGG